MSKRRRAKGIVVSAKGSSAPPAADHPVYWVVQLERAARACRSSSVRVNRQRVIKLCLLVRLITKFIESVDLSQADEARQHLRAFLDTLPEQERQTLAQEMASPTSAGTI